MITCISYTCFFLDRLSFAHHDIETSYVKEKFEIDLDEHYVKDSVEDILKNRSRQWRYKLKQLFESARSEEEARKIEVPELTRENWNKLCDMWADPEHKKRCDINRANRSKLKTNHFMGSKAFVPARAELAENGVEPDRIEFYKRTHYSTEKGWSSLEAKNHYARKLKIYCPLNPVSPKAYCSRSFALADEYQPHQAVQKSKHIPPIQLYSSKLE
ncbi:uncharacterized protein LOC132066450 [Lycium ferocissimum]|uniref:uncharacterized protein LOC132066450 n=1 Tax=Lycium ferocissimum TaxID=112874 RepID=UPI0028150E06|nr:uncharacterized protein LOC132066450 [Lycium ferocissimum]